jgi:hypothetical protein
MLPLLFAACGDNSGNGKPTPDGDNTSIVGTWALTKSDVVIDGTIPEMVDLLKQSLAESGDFEEVLGETFTFNADGTFSDGVDNGTYTYDGVTLNMTMDGETISGKLTISGNNASMTIDILDMVNEMMQEDTGMDLSTLGITKINIVMQLTRQ